jgi:hypothetical protein
MTQRDPDVVLLAVPRSALTLVERPVLVSQANAGQTLGIPRRTFLRLARAFERAGGRVVRAGKLRAVDPDAFVAWLGRSSKCNTEADVNDDIAALAEELGLK